MTKENFDESINPFTKKNCKKICLTYHNIPVDFHIGENIEEIFREINLKVIEGNNELERLALAKEPYSDPKKKDFAHLHGFIATKAFVNLRGFGTWAQRFSFRFDRKTFMPYVSEISNAFAYKNYITKLQRADAKYHDAEWFAEKGDEEEADLLQELKILTKRLDGLTKQDIQRGIISKFDLKLQLKNRKYIDYLWNKTIPWKQEVDIRHFIVTRENLLHKPEDFRKEIMANVSDKIKDYIGIANDGEPLKNKESLWFHGKANKGKSSVIKAAAIQAAEDEYDQEDDVLIVAIPDKESLKCITEEIQKKYKLIIAIIDDLDFSKDESRSEILQLLQGNIGTRVLAARYENIILGNNVVKIFIHNYKLEDILQNIKDEMRVRIKEIELKNII